MFVVRLATSPEADKPAIHGDLMQGYEQQLKLLEATNQAQAQMIEELRQKSADMLEITKLLAQRPITVNTTSHNMHIAGDVTGSALSQVEISSAEDRN